MIFMQVAGRWINIEEQKYTLAEDPMPDHNSPTKISVTVPRS